MKAISTLLKISQKKLDKLLLDKKTLLTRLEEAQNQLKIAQNEIKSEVSNYYNSEYGVFLDKYLKGANLKLDSFQKAIKNYERQIEILNEEIMEYFAEIKRYEIIAAKKKKEILLKEQKQEMKNLDELTIIKYNNN